MIGSMMELKMLLMLCLLIGVEVEASTMDHCLEMINFEGKLGSIVKLEQEEQLGIICTNLSSFFECVNKVMKENTTFDLKEVASIIKGTNVGKGTSILVSVEELVEEICVDGSRLRKDYHMNKQCFRDLHNKSMAHCENQANGAYKIFRDLRMDRTAEQKEIDDICVVTAYHMGCLGSSVPEKCGEQAFRTYQKVVWKMGFLKCGMRSTDFDHILKIRFKPRAHYKYILPR